MAIYRTLYYKDIKVGVDGRVTIPFAMRRDLRIEDGNFMTVRIEENPRGGRQMVAWRSERQPGSDDDSDADDNENVQS